MNESTNDEIDDRIRRKYVHICEQLEIDESIVNSAWENYRSVRNDHTLEVNKLFRYQSKIEMLNKLKQNSGYRFFKTVCIQF